MLLVRCANGWVAWIFRKTSLTKRGAKCLNDGFTLAYSPTPDATWAQLAADLVQHSVGLRGPFVDMFFWNLP